jgi:tetratricopeptide (TPR) repeat protein/KaiC/GvpD/RAD55 family RecA-like ATPase
MRDIQYWKGERLQSKIWTEPKFVGREQELAKLEHYLKLATKGRGKTIFISGEAGTGKTRLTNEFLKRAKNKRITILSGWCLSETTIPYFPFVEAFNVLYSTPRENEQSTSLLQPSARGIAKLLTQLRPEDEPGKPRTFSSQVWQDQTFIAVAKTLHSISATEPTILFIEDIQWADSASLALLHYLARAVNNTERILLIATFRSEELTTDTEGYPHPLTETIRMMRREDLFTEIELSNLTEDTISKLAKNMIGGSLQEKFAERLAKESRGNALFVVESLRMLSEQKSLIQENNQWRLVASQLEIPTKIKDIILRRLAVLKYAQRRVLDAASVIGEKFDSELLSTVLELDSFKVLETLNVIAKSTSLIYPDGDSYRFDHERSRKTLYEELSLPLKKGYHAKIAEKLENTKSDVMPHSDLAYHYSQAGNKEKAIKYSLEAGKDALAKFSSLEAVSHFKFVLQSLGDDSEYAEQRIMALEGLGDAFYANNNFGDARKTFENLADISTDNVKMRALTKAISATFLRGDLSNMGDTYHLFELLEKAEKSETLNRLEKARILQLKTMNLSIAGTAEGNKLAEESLSIFEEEYALSDAAHLLFVVASTAANRGEMKKSLAMSLRAIAIYEDLGDFRSQMEACNQIGVGSFSGYALYPEALDLLDKVFEIENKTKMGNYFMLATSSLSYAQILGLMGDFDGAVKKSLKALEYLEKTDSKFSLLVIYSELIINYVKLGNMSYAEEYFAKMMNLIKNMMNAKPKTDDIQPFFFQPFFVFFSCLPKAVYFAGKNQWKESIENFNKAAATKIASAKYNTHRFSLKENYAWALEKKGEIEAAKKVRQELNKIIQEYADRVKHVNVQLGLMVPINVTSGQIFEARLDIVNVSRANCTITKIEQLVPSDLDVVAIPSTCISDEGVIKLKDKNIGPFKVNTVTVSLRATKAGTFTLNPKVTYVDDLGQTKESLTEAITVTAKPEKPKYKVLPGRIPTGNTELDSLLLGGIPEKYAVVLTGSPSDERDKLIKNFLKAATEKEITFYITTEASELEDLLENPNFYLFLCNPKPKTKVPDLTNVHKLQSKADITNLGIALTKAYRSMDKLIVNKRICVEILSDVLVKHGTNTTREWVSSLITDLGAKGFTMLAVMNPAMHLANEANAVLDLFEGEISIIQSDDPLDCKKSILVKKLRNQDYIKNPICLR